MEMNDTDFSESVAEPASGNEKKRLKKEQKKERKAQVRQKKAEARALKSAKKNKRGAVENTAAAQPEITVAERTKATAQPETVVLKQTAAQPEITVAERTKAAERSETVVSQKTAAQPKTAEKSRKERLKDRKKTLFKLFHSARSEEKARQRRADRELHNTLTRIASSQEIVLDKTPLDNAALIFPAFEKTDVTNMYRISAILKEEVDPITLQRAVNDAVMRFPTISSAVKRGIFWFYLEPSAIPVVIGEDRDFPCRKIAVDSRQSQVRISYYKTRISAEFFHTATDGNGGVKFMNALLGRYFELSGRAIKDRTNCLHVLDKPDPEELADSYQQFADGVTQKKGQDVRAYAMKGTMLPPNVLVEVKGIFSGKELNAAAKSRGLTVGELLTAAYFYAIEEERKFLGRKGDRPVVVSIPANLRKYESPKTLRNFVGNMNIQMPRGLDFDGICAAVKEQFADMNNEEYFRGYVNYNVAMQKNPFVKFAPLPLKTLVMRIALRYKNTDVVTSVFSNLGRVAAPKEFNDLVDRYEFTIGGQKHAVKILTAVTFNDRVCVTISGVVRERSVEKFFFRKLASLGINVIVESDTEDL